MVDRYESIHKSPQGLGDGRPTATQIIQDEHLEGKLSDQVIFITGASSGVGLETAKALYLTGATLYLAVRNIPKTRTALGELTSSPRVHLLELDLESLEGVRNCAADFLSRSPKLNILINNAGVMAPPEGRTKDGFETQFGTNHLAHFLLFNLLKPALQAGANASPSRASRVIILSSVAHRWGEVLFDNLNFDGAYDPWAAYSQSKTANLYTSNEIERRFGPQGIHSWSVQPGFVQSELGRHMPGGSMDGLLTDPFLAGIYKNAEQGAATSVWVAVAAALEGKGGRYAENCQLVPECDPAGHRSGPGTAPWAYDMEKASKLWDISTKLTGL